MSQIRITIFVAALYVLFAASPSSAYEIEAFPGAIWGQTSYDDDNYSGSGVMGFVNQGVQWYTFPFDVKLVTYAEYRHRSRNKNQLYYDTGGPAVGVELRKSYFTLGADYYWERLPVLGESSNRAQVYLGWFVTWDINELTGGDHSFPGSSWGQVSYDNDDYSGSGVMGFINQGVELYRLPADIPMIAYAEYRHRSRTKNQLYYDSGGPAVGVEFRKSVFSWGANYYWERLPVLGEGSNRIQLYMSMFIDWDLMDLK